MRGAHVERPALQALLDEVRSKTLTIVAAPTGYGKTTELASWARATDTSVAWISLDAGDNDPVRFLGYVVTALADASGTRERSMGLRVLRRAGPDPVAAALPYLLNALARLDEPVVLVLDDYQWIESPTCHAAVRGLVDRVPEHLRVVLSTRLDPPLPLGLLRARGELEEVRARELSFSDEEAGCLLNDVLGLDLDADVVEQLNARTEGWPAGLYLAAMSLTSAPDRRAFVQSFAGSNTHVVEYLGTEVLAVIPKDARDFLLQTSILERLCAPLCDAVRAAGDSGRYLSELVRTNLFLTALDSEGQWYRYHRLFAELLRSELLRGRHELAVELHRRAAAWHHAEGHLEESVAHAIAAGDEELAAQALALHWRPFWQHGQHDSLRRLLSQLRRETVEQSSPLSFVAALLASVGTDPKEVFDRHVDRVEHGGWEGPFPDGYPSAEAAAAFARMLFPYDDFRSSLAAGERLGELAGDDPVLRIASRLGRARALYFLGDPESARGALPDCGKETAAERPMASAMTPAIRSLLALDDGDIDAGARLAQEAVDVANAVGVAEVGTLATAWVALGKALAATGDLVEAEAALERAVAMASTPADALFAADALLALARVRAALGSPADARKLLVEARTIVEPATEPGTLRVQLEELERRLSTRTRRDAALDELPTESELRVLRLMAGDATRAEIASRLFLSANTIKSHQRALYRKLGASNREDAVGRARELGLV